jgi:CHAT domain-containing protein
LLYLPVFVFSIQSQDKGEDTLQLRDLPWAEKELKSAASVVQSELYLRGDATEDAFKTNAGRFGIIHLATHVILDDKEPLYSKFVFTKNPASGEDGYLHLYELYNLRLRANLAVLSACQTGIGKNVKGEGMMSLARGFAYAGCPSVVMSLWSIDDKATSMVVSGFYNGLAQGKPKDVALRDAKLTLIHSRDPILSNPYYWAGLVVIGNTEPIALNQPGDDGAYWFFVVLAFILPGTYFVLKRKMKRKRINLL